MGPNHQWKVGHLNVFILKGLGFRILDPEHRANSEAHQGVPLLSKVILDLFQVGNQDVKRFGALFHIAVGLLPLLVSSSIHSAIQEHQGAVGQAPSG